MSLRQRDGDYIPDGAGDFQRATGTEALLEQARFALCAHRGGFPLMPEVGSRLYLLERERASVREGLARAYAQEAQKAIGVLRFSVSRALSVPLGIETGTVCFNGEGTAFETLEDGLLLAGSTYVDVKAEAVEAGTRGNVVAGSITGMQTMPDGIETVTNPQRFTGGRERETDEAYRKRILEAYMGLSNGANSAYYRKLAQSVDGIDEVAVIPRIHGAGTVGLLVMSDSGGVSQTAQDALNALLADRRELGIQVVVQEPENIGVNIQATFVPAEGYTLSQAKTAVQEAVVDYVDGLGLGKTLYPAGLYYSAMATGAIENVVFTQPTGAVIPEAGQQLVAGTVTLEGV